jgi:hypothetical protein
MPMMAVDVASPTLSEPVAVPTAIGPVIAVYKLPFIGVTPVQPANNTTALAPTNKLRNVFRITVDLLFFLRLLQVPPCLSTTSNQKTA